MSLYLGLDSSTQSLTALIIDTEKGEIVSKESVSFDKDLPEFNCPNGVFEHENEKIKHSDPLMWCAALDKLLGQMKEGGAPLADIKAISGSGQQHGSVYLNDSFPKVIEGLDSTQSLAEQLKSSLTLKTSPIWMDSSTGEECCEITDIIGPRIQEDTGSPAIERFTGAQIRKLYKNDPETYHSTSHIQLVSSFLSSILAGKVSPIDFGDGAGMNLLNLKTLQWDQEIANATAPELLEKLPPAVQSSFIVGNISQYFCDKYGFQPETACIAWSGDNPNSLIGTGASKPGTAVISLGTSDTFFGAIKSAITDPDGYGHVFGSPAGGFMSLICFTNGSLEREKVKEETGISWDEFDNKSFEITSPGNNGNMMLPYYVPENTPLVPKAGVKYIGEPDFCSGNVEAAVKVRAIVESQALSIRHHSEWIAHENPFETIRMTGGGSRSPGICQVIADVFQANVELISITDSAALGAAMRAANAAGDIAWEDLNKTFTLANKSVPPRIENAEIYKNAVLEFAELETMI